jgi:sterol desaturase/sphingolipid hydroxylase (fatty acid hydroxylase superfamily)
MTDFSWLEIGIAPVFFAVLAFLCAAERWADNLHVKADRSHRWPTNFALFIFAIAIAAMAPVSIIAVAAWSKSSGTGLLNIIAMPAGVHFALSVMAISFAGYVFHYAAHATPMLWRLHSVHHADHFVDASTSLRSHPLEDIVAYTFYGAVIVILGLSAPAIFAYAIVQIFVSLFNHSRFKLPAAADRLLSLLFVTPSFHHIHHSRHNPETDSNYGNVFSIWDYALGTYSKRHKNTDAPIEYGLQRVPPEKASDLDSMLTHPFRK